jgi:ATP-dependent DNA helicase RecG
MMRVDYIRVPGRQWVENPDHRFDTLEIRAPLITTIRRATNAITEELLKTFSLPEGSLAREDEPVLPLRVIREAVVNAVMHRSYRLQGAIQIIRYANRIEIRNPGHSLKAEEQLGEPGSETRNPRLAAVLHEVNIAETKGSGIRAMRELMIQHNLLPPTFESSRRPDQFVATFLFHHFLGPDDLAWLRSLTSEPLSDEDARALVFVREVGAIDNAAYRTFNRTDTLDASTHLRRLRSLDLLVMKGSGSRTYYVPGPAFAGNTHQSEIVENQSVDTNTHQSFENTHHLLPESPSPLGGISDELKQRIADAGVKPRQEVVRGIIHDLCAVRAFSADEICEVLGRRDPKDLVRSHLTPMREAGELSYTIPEMPNHPEQRYFTITMDEGSEE